MLSTKVITLRKNVEQNRDILKQMTMQKEDLSKGRARLEIDLKNYEVVEKRRLEVSYGTE